MESIKTIRAAILAHRGGLENASDEEIMRLWLALSDGQRQEYLRDERKKHAGDRSHTVVPGSP